MTYNHTYDYRRLARAMKRASVSPVMMAAAAGVTEQTARNHLAGYREPRAGVLAAYARIAGCEIKAFFSRRGATQRCDALAQQKAGGK